MPCRGFDDARDQGLAPLIGTRGVDGRRRGLVRGIAAAMLAPSLTGAAPTVPRSIRLVVPQAPGGSVDLVASEVGERLVAVLVASSAPKPG
jgi:hypothetical protein